MVPHGGSFLYVLDLFLPHCNRSASAPHLRNDTLSLAGRVANPGGSVSLNDSSLSPNGATSGHYLWHMTLHSSYLTPSRSRRSHQDETFIFTFTLTFTYPFNCEGRCDFTTSFFSLFFSLCSSLPSGTWRTPGLAIP